MLEDSLSIFGIQGLPEICEGDDLAKLVVDALLLRNTSLEDGDIVIITSKVVSKSEGRIIDLDTIEPNAFAQRYAQAWDKDPRVVEVVLNESKRIVRQVGPVLITETKHGFVCANSGIDQSSSGAHDRVVLLPEDPDESARTIRRKFRDLGFDIPVIISDTFGRPWRESQVDVAVGIAGMNPVTSYIGEVDPHGHEFLVQSLCVADEIASAAELVKGNVSRIPAVVVRGFSYQSDEEATMQDVLRDPQNDLFR
ncbi:MAG: coenzyme F420-0:L-glutamate ligase [Tepidiformaceae bacterium]|tara:strand:+ start:577 stop:1335 length:759 start_codon:yes stop_codon:yes gene_type:complete